MKISLDILNQKAQPDGDIKNALNAILSFPDTIITKSSIDKRYVIAEVSDDTSAVVCDFLKVDFADLLYTVCSLAKESNIAQASIGESPASNVRDIRIYLKYTGNPVLPEEMGGINLSDFLEVPHEPVSLSDGTLAQALIPQGKLLDMEDYIIIYEWAKENGYNLLHIDKVRQLMPVSLDM